MAARAIAALSLTFGLVSIPVKVYSATESSAAIRFKLMGRGGTRLRQQYVADEDDGVDASTFGLGPASVDRSASAVPSGRSAAASAATAATATTGASAPMSAPAARGAAPQAATPAPTTRRHLRLADASDIDDATEVDEPDRPAGPSAAPATGSTVVERHDIVKGYEFEKGRFVLFTPAELKALQDASRQTIDIVAFIPDGSVDPIYYDKAYFLAPDRRGEKTYSLLLAAMRKSGRCALAKWAWRSKEYVVQVRATAGGLVLQQLLYANEVRSIDDLDIPLVPVGDAELKLALQLIEQISEPRYEPDRYVDEERARILAAVEQKIAGRQVVAPAHPERPSGQVIDLMEALRASLRPAAAKAAPAPSPASADSPASRKPGRRSAKPAPVEPPAKTRSRK